MGKVHPYLKDPENARAYALLARQKTGSLRTWAYSLSWSRGRVERFLAACERYALADVARSRAGTQFRPLIVGSIGAPGVPDEAETPVPDEPETPETLPSIPRSHAVGLTTKPGLRAVSAHPRGYQSNRESVVNPGRDRLKNGLRKKAQKHEPQSGAEDLIAAMNEVLCRTHPLDYLPVDLNQAGSHRAARRWLVELGIPLEDAIALLRGKCMHFNPAKVFNAEMPRSIGFFTKAVTAEWRRLRRDREQLKLSAQTEVHYVEYEPYREEQKRPFSAQALEAGRAEMERLANDPNAMKERCR